MKNLNKTILTLSTVLLFSTVASQAYIMEDQTNSIPQLRREGFSENALRLIDDQNARYSDDSSTYVRYFKKTKSRNVFGRAYLRTKQYFDPIQEDDLFGQHQVNYTNNWMGDDHDYRAKRFVRQVEDL